MTSKKHCTCGVVGNQRTTEKLYEGSHSLWTTPCSGQLEDFQLCIVNRCRTSQPNRCLKCVIYNAGLELTHKPLSGEVAENIANREDGVVGGVGQTRHCGRQLLEWFVIHSLQCLRTYCSSQVPDDLQRERAERHMELL